MNDVDMRERASIQQAKSKTDGILRCPKLRRGVEGL